MSLASIKAKEAKGKQKSLPKLKTILASPRKEICPILSNEDRKEFGKLVSEGMVESKQDAREFLSRNNIHLGLESALRHTSKGICSIVIISLNLRPRFLISLIARSAKRNGPIVCVSANLEDFTEEIFGIRAMAMTLFKWHLHIKMAKYVVALEEWRRSQEMRLKSSKDICELTRKLEPDDDDESGVLKSAFSDSSIISSSDSKGDDTTKKVEFQPLQVVKLRPNLKKRAIAQQSTKPKKNKKAKKKQKG